jgi:hypothetical protein
MATDYDQYQQQQGMWRPHVPTPYVTHADMAPVHQKIGNLEEGQRSSTVYIANLRAEMLTQFDRIEALLRREHEDSIRDRSAAQQQEQRQITLNVREVVLFVVAFVVAGAFLGRIGFDQLIGIQ